MNPVLHALGDSAVTISIAETQGKDATRASLAAAERIRRACIPHVEEVVAAYTAVTVFYDSLQRSYDQMCAEIRRTLDPARDSETPAIESRRHSIPVRYDGPDIDAVAAATGLARERVIEIHSSRVYTVDLLGFVPGFAYLSELDKRLELPRRDQPRPRVSAGSVAIAARLTGVYPFDTPGGWHILGSTPVVMFDPRREPPALLKPGDTVKFEALP